MVGSLQSVEQRWGNWYLYLYLSTFLSTCSLLVLVLASEVLVLVLVLGCDVLVPIKNFLTVKVPASSSPVKRMVSQNTPLATPSAPAPN